MKCINFDKEFRLYLQNWMKKNSRKYRNIREMEAAMPEVYREFLETPADFLGSLCPGRYFDQWQDAKVLVNWMEDYFKQRVPVPDVLLNRIAALGMDSEKALMAVLLRDRSPAEAKMCAMSLLTEIGSAAPMQLFIEMQKDRSEDDELADKAIEGLHAMGSEAADEMRKAIFLCNDSGKEALLSLLCDFGCDDALFALSMDLLGAHPDRAAVLADYISRLGDERAVRPLTDLARSEETGYLDYIELRSAIEKLGGDAPERQFDESDPAYNALRALDRSGDPADPDEVKP